MQIGRKIYYELLTGNVIIDTGERQGDVVETTQDQDFQLYTTLQPYNQSSIGVLQLAFEQDAQNFGKYPYHVDISNQSIVWDTANPIGATLTDIQNIKISQLTDFYQQATATFQSSAKGNTYTYLADDTSMNKFNGKHYEINTTTYNGADINWYTVEVGGVMHTVAQLNQVWQDGNNYLTNQFNKWDSLVKQVKSATTVDAVNAIVWS
jgi:hypothetical protein